MKRVELTYTAQTKVGTRYGELLIANFQPPQENAVGADLGRKE